MLDLLAVGPEVTRPACRATAAAIDRYLWAAGDLSSKPADRCCMLSMDGTDRRTHGRTDGRTLHRFMPLIAYYADRVINRY